MFGKRGKPQQAQFRHPGPDEDGVARVIPKELFKGQTGELLRTIGMGPNDPTNLILTQDLVNSRLERRKEQQEQFLRSWNAQLPKPCELIPWAMIPWSIWRRPCGDFLFKQDMYPVDPWNTMLLPANEHTALVLDLPQHPRAAPQSLEDAAERGVSAIIAKVRKTLPKDFQGIGLADLARFGDVVDNGKREIRVLANYLAAELYGASAYNRHLDLFGASLGTNVPAIEKA